MKHPGLSDAPTILDYRGYKISFTLSPYPEVGKEIADRDYRLMLMVTK